jgi:hypothetical protein
MRLPPRAFPAVIAALLLLAVAFAGCGSDDGKSSDTRALVTFAKSGGIGGKAYALTVDRGGGAQLTRYPSKIKKFKIDGDKRDELVGLLDGFDRLQSSYEPGTPVADAFRYSITYGGKTVQAADNAKLPGKLRSLIDLLDGVVDDET